MKAVFADTFHFLTLLKTDDPYHARAVEMQRIRWQKIVTTDCVILEIGDACCEPADHGDFLALYDSLVNDARVKIVGRVAQMVVLLKIILPAPPAVV